MRSSIDTPHSEFKSDQEQDPHNAAPEAPRAKRQKNSTAPENVVSSPSDSESCSDLNRTLFDVAAGRVREDIRILRFRGAEFNAKNQHGHTPLVVSLLSNRPDLASTILEHTAVTTITDTYNVDIGDMHYQNLNILMIAVLKIGSIRCQDQALFTSFFAKIFQCFPDESYSIIDQQDQEGRTALMQAVTHNLDQVANILIEQGADVGIADGKGRRPLDSGQISNFAKRAYLDILKNTTRSPMFFPILEKLIAVYGREEEWRRQFWKSANDIIKIAMSNGEAKIVLHLLEKGVVDKEKEIELITPLANKFMNSTISGFKEIANLLVASIAVAETEGFKAMLDSRVLEVYNVKSCLTIETRVLLAVTIESQMNSFNENQKAIANEIITKNKINRTIAKKGINQQVDERIKLLKSLRISYEKKYEDMESSADMKEIINSAVQYFALNPEKYEEMKALQDERLKGMQEEQPPKIIELLCSEFLLQEYNHPPRTASNALYQKIKNNGLCGPLVLTVYDFGVTGLEVSDSRPQLEQVESAAYAEPTTSEEPSGYVAGDDNPRDSGLTSPSTTEMHEAEDERDDSTLGWEKEEKFEEDYQWICEMTEGNPTQEEKISSGDVPSVDIQPRKFYRVDGREEGRVVRP